MRVLYDGKIYDTDTATEIANDRFWDTLLYRTTKGNYFSHRNSIYQPDKDTIKPLTPDEAKRIFSQLPEQIEFEAAFPGDPPDYA